MKHMPHIYLPDDLQISYAVLPGDPARVTRIAKYLTDVEELEFHREYRSIRGRYHGIPILAMSTGMGGPSTAIAVEELVKIGVRAAIRVGSCGALQPQLQIGDLILASGAVREEGTSKGYAPTEYPAIPDFELLASCAESAKAEGFSHVMGIVRSHDCLYGEENQNAGAVWTPRKVWGSDQETAALFVVGTMRGMKTASILNVVSACQGDLARNISRYADGESASAAGEEHEILTALEAFRRLEEQSGVKGGSEV